MQDGRETTVFIRELSPHQSGNGNQVELDTSDKSMIPEPVIEDNANQTESANSSNFDLKQRDESVNVSQDNVTLRPSTMGVRAQNHLGGQNQLCPKNFATNYNAKIDA